MRLIPAQFIKTYRKSNKNDFINGEAIAEAVTKESMWFVPIKTENARRAGHAPGFLTFINKSTEFYYVTGGITH